MNSQVKQYFRDHAIPFEKVARYNLEINEHTISIPVYNKERKLLFKKHRHLEGDIKYTYDKGSEMSLFGIHWLRYFEKNENKPNIVLVEGEFDAMALWSIDKLGLSTTGGSGSWKDEWIEDIRDYPITILYDNDLAGAKGAYRVWDSLMNADVPSKIVVVPHGFKDISEFLAQGGKLKELVTFDINQKMLMNATAKADKVKALNKICEDLIEMKSDMKKAMHIRFLIQVFHENLKNEKMFLKRKKTKVGNSDDLEDLKRIPIEYFVRFRNGVAKCVFHNDNNPSMVYNNSNHKRYPNTVKCFSCGAFGSVIDVVMEQNGVDFKKAVEILRNYNNSHEV